jgi:hypothetical protein
MVKGRLKSRQEQKFRKCVVQKEEIEDKAL